MSNSDFFVSDTHFKYHISDDLERTKRRLFCRFLDDIRGARGLYLLGDIFDFWFEYRSSIPSYYWEILYRLGRLQESGTEILITGGNHDYWLGDFISDSMGFKILGPLETRSIQGRRVTLTHGDMLMPQDLGYKLLTRITRSRPVISLARLIHPDILYSFAEYFSSKSKGFTEGKTAYWADRMTDLAEDSLFRWNNDTFVMGHIHKPVFRRFGSRLFVILGDWEKHFSYLRLENGEFTSESYREDGSTLIETR